MTMLKCHNPECNKEYVSIDEKEETAGLGFCSFECWEKINCQTSQKRAELFDMSELFEAK